MSLIAPPTILLVDDNPSVLRLMHKWFEEHDYNLLEAANGPEAVKLAELYEGTIDVLVTDIHMPAMSGIELAHCLLSRRSTLRILLMSGYAQSEAPTGQLGVEGFAFLSKPVSPEQLFTQISDLLSNPATRHATLSPKQE